MMKTLLVGGLVLLAAMALAPTVAADPVGPCHVDTYTDPDTGLPNYVAVGCLGHCVWANLGGPARYCIH
ncbi:MAG: hypothetical protein QOI63_1917 [Thermoplasmata archaeon]|jgi:hypothetical protein|nr:hypothetical protein [Thermoplasmata archaeon]